MYEITPRVAAVLDAKGIKEEELQYMVKHSAMSRHHPKFNRRFHDWLFHVVESTVLDMRRL